MPKATLFPQDWLSVQQPRVGSESAVPPSAPRVSTHCEAIPHPAAGAQQGWQLMTQEGSGEVRQIRQHRVGRADSPLRRAEIMRSGGTICQIIEIGRRPIQELLVGTYPLFANKGIGIEPPRKGKHSHFKPFLQEHSQGTLGSRGSG